MRRVCLRVRIFASALILGVLLTANAPVRADDIFDFFEAEAQVVTASRRPQPIRQAPATVYVIPGEEIRAMGAQTIWDALRGVPGVEVMAARTSQGEVSIRGLNKAVNNRTLVLLDGKTVLTGFFDFVAWEEIPVALEEIDRIEVVEGPASALYGANAISGVINILTKAPEDIRGGRAGYALGERWTHTGHFLYGGTSGNTGYKLGLGWRSTHQFERPDARASRVFKAHGLWRYEASQERQISLSGGVADHGIQTGLTSLGTVFNDGVQGFLRADYRHQNTRLRAFWNRGRTDLREFALFEDSNFDYDTYDASLEQSIFLTRTHALVVGASYRRNDSESVSFRPTRVHQNLWAVFFEDQWDPLRQWTFLVSGRLDWHTLTGLTFSPRGSVMFHPTADHTLRVSAGTSFRNPTITESFIAFDQVIPNPGTILPNPPFETVEIGFLNNPDLEPEQVVLVEGAHSGRVGRVKTTVAVFHYRLRDLIVPTEVRPVSLTPPVFRVEASYTNTDETRAWGGEAGVEVSAADGVRLFANYAYQQITDTLDPFVSRDGGPRHKVNGGVRVQKHGFTLSLQAHWVDETFWNRNLNPSPPLDYVRVASYYLLNGRAAYAFSGRLRGLEAGVNAFNLTDDAHFEILPAQAPLTPGQNGEEIRRRVVAGLSYRF